MTKAPPGSHTHPSPQKLFFCIELSNLPRFQVAELVPGVAGAQKALDKYFHLFSFLFCKHRLLPLGPALGEGLGCWEAL